MQKLGWFIDYYKRETTFVQNELSCCRWCLDRRKSVWGDNWQLQRRLLLTFSASQADLNSRTGAQISVQHRRQHLRVRIPNNSSDVSRYKPVRRFPVWGNDGANGWSILFGNNSHQNRRPGVFVCGRFLNKLKQATTTITLTAARFFFGETLIKMLIVTAWTAKYGGSALSFQHRVFNNTTSDYHKLFTKYSAIQGHGRWLLLTLIWCQCRVTVNHKKEKTGGQASSSGQGFIIKIVSESRERREVQ